MPSGPAKFALEQLQPLTAVPAPGNEILAPALKLDNDHIMVTSFKPADDGNGIMIGLFNASLGSQTVNLSFPAEPEMIWVSDTGEKKSQKAGKEIEITGWDMVMLRVEF